MQLQSLDFKKWGFGEQQKECLRLMKSRCDVLVTGATGAGKSVLIEQYTFALQQIEDGKIVLGVVPLKMLALQIMERAKRDGWDCQLLEAGVVYSKERLRKTRGLLLFTPEKFWMDTTTKEAIMQLIIEKRVAYLYFDECHFPWLWRFFRPAFGSLKWLRQPKPTVPILATTATLSAPAKEHLKQAFDFHPKEIKLSLDRPNLTYEMRVKPVQNVDKIEALIKLRKECGNRKGIVFVSSRNELHTLFDLMTAAKVRCAAYFSGGDFACRGYLREFENSPKCVFLFTTSVLGVGRNFKDIGFVAFMTQPRGMETFVQNCGRAGRNGGPALCVLYYALRDVQKLYKHDDFVDVQNLWTVFALAITDECPRKFILEHFGGVHPTDCKDCGNKVVRKYYRQGIYMFAKVCELVLDRSDTPMTLCQLARLIESEVLTVTLHETYLMMANMFYKEILVVYDGLHVCVGEGYFFSM